MCVCCVFVQTPMLWNEKRVLTSVSLRQVVVSNMLIIPAALQHARYWHPPFLPHPRLHDCLRFLFFSRRQIGQWKGPTGAELNSLTWIRLWHREQWQAAAAPLANDFPGRCCWMRDEGDDVSKPVVVGFSFFCFNASGFSVRPIWGWECASACGH